MRWQTFAPISLALLASNLRAEPTNQTQFIGYFRTTLGVTEGQGVPDFGVPGYPNFRLGNESDTVFEVGVDHRFQPAADAPKDSYLQGVFMVSGYAPLGNSSELTAKDIAQAYVKMSRYLGNFDLWVGRRYYQRMQLGQNDYFWLNTAADAAVGAGLENLPLGPGQFDLAVMSYEDKAGFDLKAAEANPGDFTKIARATLNSRLFDLRYRDIRLGESNKVSFFLGYTHRPESLQLNLPAEDGRSGAVWLDSALGKSSNMLALQYGQGLGRSRGKPQLEYALNDDATVSKSYDVNKATFAELSETYTLNTEAYALSFLALHRQSSTGLKVVDKTEKTTWSTVGIRPEYFLSNVMSLGFELGYDQVKSLKEFTNTSAEGLVSKEAKEVSGHITKQTLALQFTKEKSAGARPVIRLFATTAQWSDSLKKSDDNKLGVVADNTNFMDKTKGWSAGVQTEVWW